MVDWGTKLVRHPAEFADRYRADGMWGSLPVGAEFHEVARRVPDQVAVVAEEGALTYAQLDEASDRLALGFAREGMEVGQRVVVQVTNRLHSVVAWYGMLKAGLIPVCTLAAHRGHEIGAISRKVDAVAHLVEVTATGFDLVAFAREQAEGHPTLRRVFVAGSRDETRGVAIERLIDESDPREARTHVAAVQGGIDPDDIACFQLSGGTTGVPKVIPRLHAEYWYNARSYAEAGNWDESTKVAHLIPIIHNAGITCGLHAAHSMGATLVLATAFLDQALPIMAREGATDVLIGHGHYTVVDHPLFASAMASMRRIVLSGAKVPDRVFEAFEAHVPWVGQKFGMGEGFFAMSTATSSRRARLTTVGVPVSAADEFRVLEPGTEDVVPEGVVGELACRGPYTIRGYFDAADINADAFTSDGFYRTGDLVCARSVDGERSLSVEGRIKDLINRGGEKVSAEEVEGLLVQHPGISAAAVVSMPDERLGERACAFLIATGEPLTMDQVQEHLAGLSLAKFKWPERLEWIDEMPKTPLGKLDKKGLQSAIARKLADA